ncbi:hypothetical protein [Yersinia enterocolitica]|uniref:hypothetical protein n=1 Tax=Yersinia enterocolitica TaxID=630 RepID=UPI00313DCAE9
MNNIKEIIVSLKTRVALAELIGPDEMIVSASDLSTLIAQLEAAQKRGDDIDENRKVAFELYQNTANRLEAANEKLSKPIVLPVGYSVRAGHPINEGKRNVMIPKEGGNWLSRFDVEHAIRVAGRLTAPPLVIFPAPAGVIIRPQFEKPLELCAAARDGECHHKDCPQLRDNEPMATGRHCPIDNWDDE